MSDEATKQLPSHNQYQTVSISNDHWVPVARNRLSKRCRILLGVFAVIGITMLLLALLLPTLLINGKSTSFTIITTTTTIITKTTSTSTIASSTSTLDADSGDIICTDARNYIQHEDENGDNFPWKS
ncbi:unnamed protein product [Adineta steineri]|uniref:Uncharacterized protein n=1 Tax=Adineta steineri TaxID=433720 RepID=A0A813NKA7_9BILA|nr:unnamed protein product [Adineta steineri]